MKQHRLYRKQRGTILFFIAAIAMIMAGCSVGRDQDQLIIVDQKHPFASDNGEGSHDSPLKTITRAAELAMPGTTVKVYEGIYRERVAPVRSGTRENPITFLAAPGEEVIISAAEIWAPEWKSAEGNVYKAQLSEDLFRGNEDQYNPFNTKLDLRSRHEDHTVTGIPCYREGYEIELTLGRVIVNDKLLLEVSSLSPSVFNYENTWKYDAGEQAVYVHFEEGVNPGEQKVEITTRKQCFAPFLRGLGYIHVKGFIMKYAGNQHPGGFWMIEENKQAGALSPRSGHHWIIENNTIIQNKSIGIDFGNEGAVEGDPIPRDSVRGHIIRNNIISDNGIGGIMGAGSRDVLIEGNLIENNNTLKMRSWEIGGIKTHFFNGVIRGNVVTGNHCFGIWLDNDYSGARVTKNVVHNNRDKGIFLEMGDGPLLVDNNIISATKTGPTGLGNEWSGDGIYTHDAGGFTITNNFIFGNEGFGILMRTLPQRAIPTENITIANNFVVENAEGNLNIPFDGNYAGNNDSENNIFSGLDRFILNTWGEKPEDFSSQLEKIKDAVRQKLNVDKINEWSGYGSKSAEGVVLDFNDWQKVTGWDADSEQSVISDIGIDQDLVLAFKLHKNPEELIWLPQEDVKEDFFGQEYAAPVFIGPFQNLKKGENSLLLHRNLPNSK